MTKYTPLQAWGGEISVQYSNPITIVFVVLFSLLMVGIGIYASRFQSNEDDYYVAGRRGGLFIIGLSIFAGLQSGWGIVGNSGVIFVAGFEYLILVALVPFFIVVSSWLLARKMRMLGDAKEAITAPDAIYHRFEDERLRLLGTISVFLGSIGYLAPQYAALGIIGAIILPVNFLQALILGLVVVGFYTVIGGMLASIWSDAIQGAMMALAGVLTSFYIVTNFPGGVTGMINTISTESPNYFNLTLLGMESNVLQIGFFISFLIVFATTAGQPHFIIKFYMSRDISVLRWSAALAGGAYLLSVLFFTAPLFMKAAVLEGQISGDINPDAALPLAVIEFAPPIVVAFILTSVLAAIMSTANAFLNMGAAAIVHDFLQEYRGMSLSDHQQVLYGRLTTLVILISALVLAATFSDLIFVIGAAGWAIYASVLFPCVALAYNWKNATAEGALWGGSIGVGLTIILAYGSAYAGFTLPMGFLGGQLATVAGVIVFIVVSLITSTNEYDDLDQDIKMILDMGRLNDSGRESIPATDGKGNYEKE